MTPVLLGLSFAGTRTLGPDRTAAALRQVGGLARHLPRRRATVDDVERRVRRGYRFLPLPVECLDQALVYWYLCNVHGHAATLKIGMKLTPLQGHAWVEIGGRVLGAIPGIEDMAVVGRFEPWPAPAHFFTRRPRPRSSSTRASMSPRMASGSSPS